jgi:OOP family OmpA-OmpF porin
MLKAYPRPRSAHPASCLVLLAAMFLTANPLPSVAAEDFLNQRWHVNPEASFLTVQSVKKNEVLETHRFTNFGGSIGPDGKAEIKIDLASIETGVDIRNVRMRFLLFETYKFPIARISAEIPTAEMRKLETTKRIVYPLTFTLDLHGLTKTFTADAVVSRTYDNAVSVTPTAPLIVKAADFGMSEGVVKLAEAVGNIAITPAAFVNFNILFEGERFNPEVRQVVAKAETRAEEQKVAAIDEAGCQTELEGLSESRAIYFRSGSSNLNPRSAPVLTTLVGLLKRCGNVVVEAGGHTDNIGSAAANLRLSKARAAAVVDYLVEQGIPQAQLRAEGYGDAQPVVPNTNRRNRARNRRIEFRIVGELREKADAGSR